METLDTQVKLAVYRHFAVHGERPSIAQVGEAVAITADAVVEAYGRLRAERVLLLEDDGRSIRMAPPFSGIPTQHRVRVGATSYFANCAWDALGVPAALGRRGTIESRCEASHEPLRLEVGVDGLEAGSQTDGWLFHCQVPAAHWWDDLVFT